MTALLEESGQCSDAFPTEQRKRQKAQKAAGHVAKKTPQIVEDHHDDCGEDLAPPRRRLLQRVVRRHRVAAPIVAPQVLFRLGEGTLHLEVRIGWRAAEGLQILLLSQDNWTWN